MIETLEPGETLAQKFEIEGDAKFCILAESSAPVAYRFLDWQGKHFAGGSSSDKKFVFGTMAPSGLGHITLEIENTSERAAVVVYRIYEGWEMVTHHCFRQSIVGWPQAEVRGCSPRLFWAVAFVMLLIGTLK